MNKMMATKNSRKDYEEKIFINDDITLLKELIYFGVVYNTI